MKAEGIRADQQDERRTIIEDNTIGMVDGFDQLYSPEGRKTEEKNTHINLTN